MVELQPLPLLKLVLPMMLVVIYLLQGVQEQYVSLLVMVVQTILKTLSNYRYKILNQLHKRVKVVELAFKQNMIVLHIMLLQLLV